MELRYKKRKGENRIFFLVFLFKQGIKTSSSPISMPPKGGNPNLTDQDIRKVLEYMREKFAGE